jgi:hypothetical protein
MYTLQKLNKYTAVAALKRVAACYRSLVGVMLEQDISRSKKIFLLGKWKESKKELET